MPDIPLDPQGRSDRSQRGGASELPHFLKHVRWDKLREEYDAVPSEMLNIRCLIEMVQEAAVEDYGVPDETVYGTRVLCRACSEAGGADRAVYHSPPECKA